MFDPLPMGWKISTTKDAMPRISVAPAIAASAPKNIEDVAFSTVRQLAELVKARKSFLDGVDGNVSRALEALRPKLLFVITLTEDRAKTQAREADARLRRENIRVCCTEFRGAEKICWR